MNEEDREDDFEEEGDELRADLFGFFSEDQSAIADLAGLVRSAICRPSTDAGQIFHLSKLLFAVERFPLPTKGVEIELSLGEKFDNGEMSSQTLLLDSISFRVGRAGYVIDDPSAGGDGVSETVFEVEVGGFRDIEHPFALIDWIEELRERLQDEGQVLEITDGGNLSDLNWSAESTEYLWRKLESGDM